MLNKVLSLVKTNPVSQKYRDIKNAFTGMVLGFLLIAVSFVILVLSFTMVKEHSKLLQTVEVMTASEAEGEEDLVMIQSTPETDGITFEYSACGDAACSFEVEDSTATIEGLLYYEVTYQRYEVVKETVTETVTKTVNGEEVTETVEKDVYDEEWVTKESAEQWATFSFGEIEINPAELDHILEKDREELTNVYISNLRPLETYGREVSSQVGDTRVVIEYIEQGGELLVVGDLNDNEIKVGDPGIITDLDRSELIDHLANKEATQRNLLRIASWVVLFVGFYLILAPTLEFIEMIPLVGGAAKFVAVLTAAIVAAVVILTGILIVKFWYLFIALAVLIMILGVYALVRVLDKDEAVVDRSEA